jgi:hypothetical protein
MMDENDWSSNAYLNPVCMELTRSFKHQQKSKVTRPKNIKVGLQNINNTNKVHKQTLLHVQIKMVTLPKPRRDWNIGFADRERHYAIAQDVCSSAYVRRSEFGVRKSI